jgi:NAD(P)H-nitrite reductase large subunit
MKLDKLDKGAVVQRDRETYGVAPHIPAGIVTPELLRKIAATAEQFSAGQIKITSAQRIALLGIREDDLDAVWDEFDQTPGHVLGFCVRSVKVCPGTDWCKRGQQDSVKLGLQVDARYHGMALPWKFKLGVSGCINDCAETCVKDIGLVGTAKGWHITVGGNGGSQPRLAKRLFEHVPSEAEALQIVDRLVAWFKQQDRKCRMGKLVDEVGLDELRKVLEENRET